jgi:hypothetical protein
MSKTHVIDGVTYVEVERSAKVGDKIVMIDHGDDGYDTGDIFDVKGTDEYYANFRDNDGHHRSAVKERYRVLEPLTSNPDLVEILANLAHRVHSLEQQLRDTQRNIERQAEELENAKQSIESAEVFDLAGIKSFKLSDLNGKTLRIYVSTDFADGVSVTTTVAIDINDGRMYVLDNEVIVE